MDMYGEGTASQRAAVFDKMHGESVRDNFWIYYADGATREVNPNGAFMEPPSDPRERQNKVVYFHKLRLEQAVRTFDTVKREFRDNPNGYPNREENLEDLKALQEEAQTFKASLADAQETLRRMTPGYRTPEEEAETVRINAAIAAGKSDYLSALDAIQV